LTDDSEPPINYHTWCGISVIASALQRRAFVNWGHQIIYPNLFIVLVGPSGGAKKGTAMDFARPFMEHLKSMELIDGSITREKLIRRMSTATRNYIDGDTGMPGNQCAATCISDELSVFLGQHNIRFLADLCNWYDCPNSWRYDTKNMGTDELNGLCFNLLGATAPDWIPTIIPTEAIGGGFTSRVIWVVEERKRKTVVYPSFDPKLQKALLNDLEQINLISGKFTLTEDAKRWYEEWYLDHDVSVQEGTHSIREPKLSGYLERKATLIKKIAMVVSAAESGRRIVDVPHFENVLKILADVELKMGRAFSGIGQARYAYATELILGFIARHKIVTRSQILSHFYKDIDLLTFNVIRSTLESMGCVKTVDKIKEREVVLELVEGKYAEFM